MVARPAVLRVLVFLSGASALAYQVVWTRELRLVFGHSTAAAAAVVAIFVGGLGFGSWLLGPRADRHPRPLALYARLEGLIALSAALTLLLVPLIAALYVRFGGSGRLGLFLATVARLGLAALVLGAPTFLMGGTLPAAARVVEGAGDARRRGTAVLYGLNTLGASAGALLATFFALERLGSRGTLTAAVGLNVAVAVTAMLGARGAGGAPDEEAGAAVSAPGPTSGAPRGFVLVAAGTVGFAFFLLEIVWYRMLGALLAGTVYTFGLILGVALAGIALGGLLYGFRAGRPLTLTAFALTSLLEAAAVAAPLALGDRLALFALLIRPLGEAGMPGAVLGWSVVTAVVVLPAAIVAGVQFPLLIALLGRGRAGLGRDVGYATAANTAGAILGALVGGFGLLPLLTAPGCWRLAAALLAVLGLAAALLAGGGRRGLPLPAALAGLVGLLLAAPGPTAAFRYRGIGPGRADLGPDPGPAAIEDWLRERRRGLVWEAEGVESSVALVGGTGLAFSVNGKIDGHARYDAPTQVMVGLLGALFHPRPARVLVVGLGTGSTAGWLAEVPGVQRVDVVELEPAVVEVARRCASVNRYVLENPRVRLVFGDARETLLTSRERYDLVVSEPSNPYRAGIASLFSREFYRAVADRLADGGLFVQWLQAYEIDATAMRSVYRTLGAELPVVETWQTHTRDLALLASRRPLDHDVARLRRRIREEPFRSALRDAWRTSSVEGVFARFVGTPDLARRLAAVEGTPLNTDDRNSLEFGFARALGREGLLDVAAVREAASAARDDLPALREGTIDLLRVEDERLGIWSGSGEVPPHVRLPLADLVRRAAAHGFWSKRQRPAALEAWRGQDHPPEGPNEIALVAEVTADAGDPSAEGLVAALRAEQPAEADACLGRLRLRQMRYEEALSALGTALERYRTDPWPAPLVMQGALDAALELAGQRPDLAPRVLEILREPFALHMLDEVRREEAFLIGSLDEPGPDCARLFADVEPNVPFNAEWLGYRKRCYALLDHPLLLRAIEDFDRYHALVAEPLVPEGWPSPPAAP
jgi:spermidine synthase